MKLVKQTLFSASCWCFLLGLAFMWNPQAIQAETSIDNIEESMETNKNLTIRNNGSCAVNIYWWRTTGDVYYTTIQPGNHWLIRTTQGHKWRAVDTDNVWASLKYYQMYTTTSSTYQTWNISPTYCATTCTGRITGVKLNKQNGSALVNLTNGATFCESELPNHIRIRTTESGTHESLKYTITGPGGPWTNIENQITYDSEQFWPTPGTYTVKAELYKDHNATGTKCDTETITFTVRAQSTVTSGGTFSPRATVSCNVDNFNQGSIQPSAGRCSDGSTPNYQWQVKPETTGSWTIITGATSAFYNPPSQGIGSKWYRRSTACGCSNIVKYTTNVYDIHVYNPNAGVIAGNEDSCDSFNPATMTSTSGASKGIGNLSYQWQRRTANGAWINISNAIWATYNPSFIVETTQYRRLAEYDSQCTDVVISNVITKRIDDCAAVPVISIGDLTVNEGAGTATLTFTLNQATTVDTKINFASEGNSAISGLDFVGNSGMVTILAGQTSGTITFNILEDMIEESDELFLVRLTNPQGLTIADGTGRVTIVDNDDPADIPTVSIGDLVVQETAGTATLTVTLSQPTTVDTKVNFASENNSAIAGVDFVGNSGMLTIPAGQTTGTITFTILDDTTEEPNEQFLVRLTNPQGLTIADGTGRVVIIDNDDPVVVPTVSIGDVVVDEAAGIANLTVSLSQPTTVDTKVNYATSNNSATAGSDYIANNGMVTIPAGQTSATVTFNILEDATEEPAEVFNVTLSNPQGVTIADGSGTVTILDNDDPIPVTPLVSIGDVVVNEADGTATLTVSLSQPTTVDTKVNYATSNNTATAGSDYMGNNGMVTIPAGQTSATVTFNILEDTTDEPTEVFNVTLSNPQGVTIADGLGTVTIIDNDDPIQVTPLLSIGDVVVNEADGTATLTVSINQTSPNATLVNFSTSNGTATAGSDYSANNGIVTIPAGQTSATITFNILEDTTDESDEIFNVTLATPQGATIADGVGTVTIIDNDDPNPVTPLVSIDDVVVNEADGTATLTVSLNQPTTVDTKVNYGTSNSTALSGSDYTTKNGMVTIPAGQTSATITFDILEDTQDESDELFNVTLSNPQGVTIADGIGTVLIIDNDDPAPSNCNATYSVSGRTITVSNLTGAIRAVKIIDNQWNTLYSCDDWGGNVCGNSETFTVPTCGTYSVQIQTYADWSTPICNLFETVEVNSNCGGGGVDCPTLNANIGDPCDDGMSGTINDMISPACTCAGTVIVDCPGLNANIGDICDDGNANTINDTVNGNCNCVGTPNGGGTCTATYRVEGDKVIIDGLNAPIVSAKILTNTWSTVAECSDWTTACGGMLMATVQPGDYFVQIQTYTDWSNQVCDVFETVTVGGNPTTPNISIGDVTVNENVGTGVAGLTVTLDQPSNQPVTINYTTSNGTAQAPGDYTSTTSSITIPAGQTTTTITIPISDDSTNEQNEVFNVTITNANGGNITDGVGTVTIIDNDGVPTIPNITIGDITVNEIDGTAVATVSLSSTTNQPVTVNFSTSNGSAQAPGDYSNTTGMVTIPAGQTSATISIPLTNDNADENDETFNIDLTNPNGGNITDSQGVVTILDDDGFPPTCIATYSVTGRTITVNNINSPITLVKVIDSNWNTVSECTPWAGAACGSSYTSTVPTCGTYFVQIQTYTDWSNQICNLLETVVVDSDCGGGGPTTPNVTINDVSVNENDGTATVTVSLSQPSSQPVTVTYNTSNGTAQAPGDYTSTTNSITIPAGQTTGTIIVPITNDASVELNETFNVNLTNANGGTITDATGIVTIIDEDSPVSNCSAQVSTTGSKITVSNITGAITAVKFLDASWNVLQSCDDWTTACGSMEMYTVAASGTYYVQVQTYADWSTPICDLFETVIITDVNPVCDNVTNGGTIAGNETGCGTYDPAMITSAAAPSGGSGAIEYLWLSSTTSCPRNLNQAIAGANGATYNPGPISQTTYYVRCSRRAGCDVWTAGESNCVVKTVDNNCNTVCADRTATSSNECNSGSSYGVYTAGGNFFPISNGSFVEYTNGTAQFTGHASGLGAIDVTFTGRTSNGTPKFSTCLGTVSTADWYYYTAFSGTIGHLTISRRGEEFHVGTGGNNQQGGVLGASGWWEATDGTLGDINILLSGGAFACSHNPRMGNGNLNENFIVEGQDVQVANEVVDFTLYPNPASETMNVSLVGYEGKDVTIQMIDFAGKPVKSVSLDNVNDTKVSIPIESVSNGIYTVRILSDGIKPVGKKMIVNKQF